MAAGQAGVEEEEVLVLLDLQVLGLQVAQEAGQREPQAGRVALLVHQRVDLMEQAAVGVLLPLGYLLAEHLLMVVQAEVVISKPQQVAVHYLVVQAVVEEVK